MADQLNVTDAEKNKKIYNICIIQPSGYIHSAAFTELAELLLYSLKDLGFRATLGINRIEPDSINIIIGVHLAEQGFIKKVPKSTIILNTEQIDSLVDRNFELWKENIFSWAEKFEVWDYSERNILGFRHFGIENIRFLQIGFQKELVKIEKSEMQDIDVLFYGSRNDRRMRVIEELKRRGLATHAVFGIYGDQRDELISRSKVILNLHFHDSKIFEVVRVFYLMINSKAVVCEINPGTSINPLYLSGIYSTDYDDIVDSCIKVVEDQQLRLDLELRAFNTISKFPQRKFTSEVIAA